nr:MAG TPA: hypothetical protein [Caudoviricetes sp.]
MLHLRKRRNPCVFNGSGVFILSFFVDAHQQQLSFIFLFLSLSASQRISFSLFTLLKL